MSLFKEWINKPNYEILTGDSSDACALIINCAGSLMASDQQIYDYNENITIVNDQTGIPFDALHNELMTTFNEWIMKKEEEHN